MRSSCAAVDRRWRHGLLATITLLAGLAVTAARALPAGTVSTVQVEHVVQAGESLTRVAARYGITVALLTRQNALSPAARLRPGQVLRVESRHLLPQPLAASVPDGVLINAAQRMLWLRRDGGTVAAMPVTVGRHDWPTPLGRFTVANRQTDKPWIVPPSIQREMREQGKPVLTEVAPGPDNPLGRHWIGLSLPGIGIHGTNAPSSIYGFRSHGCIRMHPDDVAALFEQVRVGTPGQIVYQPVMLVRDDTGRIWFEANPDPYRRDRSTTLQSLRRTAEGAGVADLVDWAQVERQWRERDGQARPVGRTGGGEGQSRPS